jgi:chemotaxis protein MotB
MPTPDLDQDLDAPPIVGGNKAWLITFTDTVSLLLTFFVLLFSMSSISSDRFKEITDSLSQSLHPIKVEKTVVPTVAFNIGTIFRRQAVNLDYLASVLGEMAARDPLLSGIQLIRQEDRLVAALPGDLLFEQGRALMTDGARDALFRLGGLLRNIGNTIGTAGHSDPGPPAGQEFTSNWELSLARAAAVANALRRAGYPHDIVAFGFADNRYGELAGLPENERQVLARRVDVIILNTARED